MTTFTPWTQPDWLAQASAWIQALLEAQHLQLIASLDPFHVRPWSTVVRVPTDGGLYYFKATAPALAHEPALTQALAGWRPDCIPRVLAADLERGWLLLADAGAALRSLIQSPGDLGRRDAVLSLYAGLQIELAGQVPTLLALGALDRRLATLPAQYERLLEDTPMLRIGQPDGLTAGEYRRLHALAPRFAGLCRRLAEYPLPETLHHDDFHDGNVFVRDGRYLLTDWGESCVAHPFFTLQVMLRSSAYRVQLPHDAPELAHLRDHYLAAWTHLAPYPQLLEAFRLAQCLATVCRALTWHRVISSLEEAERTPYADAVPGWMQEFLAAETRE